MPYRSRLGDIHRHGGGAGLGGDIGIRRANGIKTVCAVHTNMTLPLRHGPLQRGQEKTSDKVHKSK